LEHVRDHREQGLSLEMTSDGAMNVDEDGELIGGEFEVLRPLESALKLVGALLASASRRSDGLRHASTQVWQRITSHATCTY
jgi:hypothetical protein